MARDPRKSGAFDSGMRGREKPKVQGAHGGTFGQEKEGSAGGESKQGPDTQVGNPDGVNLNDSAYSSGMRGVEKAKQKPASGEANMFAEKGSATGGENKAGPNKVTGHPSGHNDAATGVSKGVQDDHMRNAAKDAYGLGGTDGVVNSSEEAAAGHQPSGTEGILGEEDDTHINVRIPKAALKRKAPGLHTS